MSYSSEDAHRVIAPQVMTAVNVVLHDLQLPDPLRLRVSADARGIRICDDHGTSTGIPIEFGGGPELVVDIADWLQEQFFFETRDAWGEARPACPGHTHPASAAVIDGQAWWTCPRDDRQISLIGRLGDWPGGP